MWPIAVHYEFSLVSNVGPCTTASFSFCSAPLISVMSVSMWVLCSFFIDRQCNDALWTSPAGFVSCCTLVSSHCQGMSISCPSAWPLFSPVTDCPLWVCLPLHGHAHLCDCLSGVSFSWQVWRSPWGWWRDLEALARGELLPLWEGTVVMLRGSMRSTATMLNSVTVSPWTEAFPTTDLKSMSTSCFFAFSDMYVVLPTTALHLFFSQQGCVVLERLVTGRFSSLILAVADGLYLIEGAQRTAKPFVRKLAISSSVLCFSSSSSSFSFMLVSWWIGDLRFSVPKQNQSCSNYVEEF